MHYSSQATRMRRKPAYGRRKPKYRSKNSGHHGQHINPQRFIKAAKSLERTLYTPTNDSFNSFNMHQDIKQNVSKRNYTLPTQIQDKAIPIALEGKDVIGIANTGTGKTAAFLLPILDKLITNRKDKAIILAPTRELALQIQEEFVLFSKDLGFKSILLIGGVPVGPQLRKLRNRPDVFIGTPGRVKDHINRGTLRLVSVSTIVLDEVDRMLDMGFVKDIRYILNKVPKHRQSLFFSATINPAVESLISTFTESPISIMARTAETSDNVEQSTIQYAGTAEKLTKLHDLLIGEDVRKTLIFAETKRSVDRLSKELSARGFKSDVMHGNKSQSQRQRALRNFREGKVAMLVATDVAARGIDVDGITHVINYDIPQTYDDYTHRIGRTGRSNNKGYAVTFVPTNGR